MGMNLIRNGMIVSSFLDKQEESDRFRSFTSCPTWPGAGSSKHFWYLEIPKINKIVS